MRYLLDTNIVSSLYADPHGSAAERAAGCQAAELGTSIIVAAELRYGYIKKGSKRLERLIETTLASLAIASWDEPADLAYAHLRSSLEKSGIKAGQNDLLIAAQALALDATLVSDDRIFQRMPQLRVENWLRDQPAELG